MRTIVPLVTLDVNRKGAKTVPEDPSPEGGIAPTQQGRVVGPARRRV
jgi:hypothetical protein